MDVRVAEAVHGWPGATSGARGQGRRLRTRAPRERSHAVPWGPGTATNLPQPLERRATPGFRRPRPQARAAELRDGAVA